MPDLVCPIQGLLKGKLARLRVMLLEPTGKSEKGVGFDVPRSGDARVALIGFPSGTAHER